MDWPTTFLLAALLLVLGLAVLRAERSLRRWVVLLVPVPAVVLIVRWASYRKTRAEALVALGIAGAALLLWWLAIGRRLPSPASRIRVWTKDDPF